MGMDDLSYLEAMMGAGSEDSGNAAGGVWVVSLDGVVDDALLRLVGKARVVADSLGSYVYCLLCGNPSAESAQPAIHAGADQVLLANGLPALPDLVEFFSARGPQVVLFPRTAPARALGPALAQALGGGLAGYAADLAVDPVYQRLVAHQPVLDGEARQVITITASPAVAVVDTGALPAPFVEPWRNGQVEETGLTWSAESAPALVEMPAVPLTLANARVVVAAGRGLRDKAGFELAEQVAEALGGVVGGDVSALDAQWIEEDRLVGLTGQAVAPKLYLALGISGDDGHFMATAQARTIVAVQPDPRAPIVAVADWNIIADPADFARSLLDKLTALT